MKHLLGVAELGAAGLVELLTLADSFAEVNRRAIPKVPALRGRTVVLAFFEDSTRTRVSFETAAKRLSADTIGLSSSGTSASKGESLRDTALTIAALGVDALVVRHRSSGVPHQLARWLGEGAAIVNAGDGWHQHPTQALVDCWTLRSRFGSLAGLHVALIGDIRHSRVARSDVAAFTMLGADVTIVAPRTLLPPSTDGWAPGPGTLKVTGDLDGVLGSVDVLYLLRMQLERQSEALVPSLREYAARYGIDDRRADRLRDGAVVLHPGPMNRGVEITDAVADGPRSLVLDQVAAGVAVRMAVLFRLLAGAGGGPPVSGGARLLVRGGTVLDGGGERRADVLVGEDGRVAAVGRGLSAATVLDADGCLVAPGLVELSAQLGQPGREGCETVESGTRAAVLGGFTAVVARSDTDPVVDCAAVVREIEALAAAALCEVVPSATVTVGGVGSGRLAPLAELAGLGVRLFADEGCGTQDPALLRRALEYAADLDVVVGQYPLDPALAAGGCAHEGEWSSRLGLAGIPAEAEELAVMRDLALARLTGGRLHLRRLTTASSLAMAGAARRAGLPVTVEAAIHHALLTDAALSDYDPDALFRPPLRPEADRAALVAALQGDGVDVLSSAHSPLPPQAKDRPLDEAEPGAVGLETVLALALTCLQLPLRRLLELLSWRPARLAGLEATQGGPVEAGRPGNLCVIDPAARWTYRPEAGASRGRNTPFGGWELQGRVRHTLVDGEPVVVDGEARR